MTTEKTASSPLGADASSTPRRIIAEIISIGDEITSGAILDTNAQYLSRSLSEIGVRVLYHSTIGDDFAAMTGAFALAFRRADVVVVTGGLGPTQDDLTRQVASQTLGGELMFDPDSFAHIEGLFARRGRVMTESNKIHAYFPLGSQVIFNPNGTAPGFYYEGSRSRLRDSASRAANEQTNAQNEAKQDFIALFFPGVPAELREMWNGPNGRAAVERFADRLLEGRRPVYRSKTIRTFGAGESALEARLPNLIARDRVPTVGITAKDSVISLRILAEGATEAECQRQIEETSKFIYDRAGEFIFGEEDETLQSVVSRVLRAQCLKVGVFEWGTRGLLGAQIENDVLSFSRVFGESERDAFARLFPAPSDATDVISSVSPSDVSSPRPRDPFGPEQIVETEISDALRSTLATLDADVAFCLAIGPYPTVYAAEVSEPRQTVVAFVDLRDSERPVVRLETFAFGGHPAVVDALFCNRALDALRKFQ
jgi:nicotinamide-nucleotide amidase